MKPLFYYILFFCISCTIQASGNDPDFESVSNLMTLFTSSAERDQLDHLRSSGKFEKHSGHVTHSPLNNNLTVNMQGLVIPSTNTPIVFINDNNTLKSNIINNQITIKHKSINTASTSVPLRINQVPVSLKPGQAWNESARTTQESYQIKHIKNKPSGLPTSPLSKIIE